MTRRRAFVRTWGCQMNEHKSEGIAGLLADEGYELVDSAEEADVVVFNTCMVREKPEEKVYSEAGTIRNLKEKNPDMMLGVGGCVAQAMGEKIAERSPTVDFVFGSSNITDIPRLIREAEQRRETENGKRAEPVMAISKIPDRIEDTPFIRHSSFQGKVTITEGCSNFCSFCVVPYTTGLLRSRYPGEVIQEVRELADQNYQEVQLLGQNVDSYGNDLDDPDITFAKLLDALTAIDISRIRFTSSHPQDITPDVIDVMSRPNNVCEHVHMAVQAGSDRVLEAMRRGYTKDEFLQLVDDLKSTVPGVNVTTDIIVGFPTETDDDFQETVDLVEKARFGGAFIFKYSPRPGTISYYKYDDDVPDDEKQRRLEHLLDLQKRITDEENRRRVGETLEVLAEGPAKRKNEGPDRYLGKTRDNRTVLFEGSEDMVGTRVNVEIDEGSVAGLVGRVVAD